MSIKSKLLTSFLAALLVLALAISLLVVFRLTLIPQLCNKLAGLDCQLERLDLKLDARHFTVDIGEASIAANGQKILTNQSLTAQLLWPDLFSRKITLEYIRGHGLFFDGVASSEWFSSSSRPAPAPAPQSIDAETVQLESNAEQASMDYLLKRVALRDWQILLPGGTDPIKLSIAQLSSNIDQQDHKRAINLAGTLQDKPITFSVDMTQPVYAVREKAPFAVKLEADVAGIIVNGDGKINLFTEAYDSRFDFSIDARAVTELAALFDLTLPAYEALSIDGKIEARDGKFYDINDFSVRIRTDKDLKIDIHGTVKNILLAIEPHLILDANISSLSSLLSTFGIDDLTTDLKISASGEIVRDDNRIAIQQLNAGVTLDGETTQYGDQYTLKGSELKLAISLKDLLAQDGFSLPLFVSGGLLTANVDFDQHAYGFDINVDALPLTVTDQGLTLKLDGRYKKQGLKLDFSLDKDWTVLAATLKSSLLNATTHANLGGTAMVFENHLELLDDEMLARLSSVPLPAIESLVVDARLVIADSIVLEKSKLRLTNEFMFVKFDSQWKSQNGFHDIGVEIKASEFAGLAKFNRQIRLNIDNAPDTPMLLANLATRSTVDTSKQPAIPRVDDAKWDEVIKNNPWSLSPLTFKTDVRFKPGKLVVNSLSMDMVGELVDGHISGKADFSSSTNSLDLTIDTQVKSGAFNLLEDDFSLKGAIASQGNTISSKDLLLHYGKGVSDLDFVLDLENPDKPALTASITIDDLDLSPLMRQWQASEEVLSAGEVLGASSQDEELETEASSDGRVIPDIPLPIDWLHSATLDIDYRINRLNLSMLTINQWQGSIQLDNGLLDWPENKLDLLGGDITFDVHVDSQQPVPQWQLNMQVDRLNPADMRRNEIALLDGPISGRVKLKGQGVGLRGLMGSLDGRITLGMNDTKLHGANLNSLAPNFLKSTLRILNPFSGKEKEKEKETFFECGVFHALLDSGVVLADDSILARTKETDILASWKLDLTTEQQVIQAYPKQRATIALPTGDLAKAIEVSGTLAKPKVGVNTGDLVTGGAKTAFFFVGGWVYVMSKNEWDKRSDKEGACQKARDYWLGNSLAQMKQHEIDKQQHKAEKKAARKKHGPTRRHGRRPR